MEIIDMPTSLRPASVDWGLFVPQLVGRSAFDGSAQANTLGPPRWFFTIATGVLYASEVAEWEAVTDRLMGGVNRLRAWDWRREAPLTPGGYGTPTVRVTGTGSSLQTQGWTASVAGILRAGSYVGINGELKRLSQTIDSDSAGRATITFKPPLRAAAPADVPLVLVKPTALFMLTSERPSMAQQGNKHPGQTLTFMEDFAS